MSQKESLKAFRSMKYLQTHNGSSALKGAQDSGNSGGGCSTAREATTGLWTKESALGNTQSDSQRGNARKTSVCVCVCGRERR